MAASRENIQCLSFKFEQCTILKVLIFQLNAMIIMYELLGRKERFVVRSYIYLKKKKKMKAKILKEASCT